MSAAAVNGGAAQSMAGGLPILSQQYLNSYKVGTSGKDVIWGPLYDSQAYPSAGGLSFTFFNQGIGGGVTSAPAAGTGAKTIQDTNLTTPNLLPAGNEFYCIGSETWIQPGVQNVAATPFAYFPGRVASQVTVGQFANDLWAILNAGVKTLTVLTDRKYINDGPLMQFPPSKWLHVEAAVAEIGPSSTSTGVGMEITYARGAGEPYLLVPIYIQSMNQFALTVAFAAAIATPSQQVARWIERLRGYLIRQIT